MLEQLSKEMSLFVFIIIIISLFHITGTIATVLTAIPQYFNRS